MGNGAIATSDNIDPPSVVRRIKELIGEELVKFLSIVAVHLEPLDAFSSSQPMSLQ